MAKRKTSAKRKLKVFRTPIGFHDAYVAAPSQKAALEAWGSDANLFARGSAEEVSEPELMKAPLERPGEVIKVLRGSEAEQIRALGKVAKTVPASKGSKDPSPRSASPSRPLPQGERGREAGRGDRPGADPSPRSTSPSRPLPQGERGRGARRPGRGAVEKAERALAAAERRQRAAMERIRAEAAKLEAKRRALEDKHEAELEALRARVGQARADYAAAMSAWADA